MDVSAKGLDFIAHFEGCVLHPYNDAGPGRGNATIGVGHLIHMGTVTPEDVKHYKGFTRTQAVKLLHEDAAHAVAAVRGLGLTLKQTEFDALVSFAFNCGGGALTGGITRDLHAGHHKEAAMAVLREYVHAGGVVVPGLVRRRHAESHLFLDAVYA